MTKAELIEIFAALSRAETALISMNVPCPDHVLEGISLAIEVLRRELLK